DRYGGIELRELGGIVHGAEIDRRRHGARTDADNQNVVLGELDTGGAREHAPAALSPGGGGIGRPLPILVARGGIYGWGAAALLDHLPRCDLRAEKCALEVYRHDPVVLRLGRVQHGGTRFDAGVVDHDVEPAELVDCRGDELLEIGELAHVGLDADRTAAELADARLQRPGRFRMRHVVDDDAGLLPCEFQGDRLPDPAVAAGDDGNLVLQRHVRVLDDDLQRSSALPYP